MSEKGQKACDHCQERTQAWLISHMEHWHGPISGWTTAQRDKFLVDLSLLNLFAEDFQFSEEKGGTP